MSARRTTVCALAFSAESLAALACGSDDSLVRAPDSPRSAGPLPPRSTAGGSVSDAASPDVDAAPPYPPHRKGPPAPKVITLLQGQSNAVFLQTGDGYWGVYAPLVKDLTGIPEHDAQAVRSDYSDPAKGYTLASGTPTYSFGGDSAGLWLDATAAGAKLDDPSTWPAGAHGTALQHHFESHITGKAPAGVPVVVLRFHSEYDSTKTGAQAAAYAAANHRFVSLIRTWVGKPTDEVPVFLGMPGFLMNTTSEALDAIRDGWRDDIADPMAACHWMFGNVYDTSDRGDLSHMDEAGDKAVGSRAALAVSRWLFDNGYAHNDLSWLPRLGARIAQIKRVAGMPDAIDAVVQQDKGTDLIVPAGVETGVVDVDDDGTLRKAVSIMRVDATTLRIRLDGSLGANDANIRFDYIKWPSYNGTGKLVTDNWRTAGAKPAWAATIANLDAVELPLRRLDRPLVLGALAMSDPDR